MSSLNGVTVAPITSTIRGLAIEVPVGREQGLDQAAYGLLPLKP